MKTGRMIAQVRSKLATATTNNDTEQVQRLLLVLTLLQKDYITELEKTLSLRKAS